MDCLLIHYYNSDNDNDLFRSLNDQHKEEYADGFTDNIASSDL